MWNKHVQLFKNQYLVPEPQSVNHMTQKFIIPNYAKTKREKNILIFNGF